MRKFHRWIGLLASVWLLLLASTGFLLQHSHQWQLDKKYISNTLVLNAYGIGAQFIAFKQDKHQLIQLDNQLIQDNTVTIKLSENIHSAIYHQNHWVIATHTKIFWIDDSGQIIKSLDDLDGLKLPINNIGLNHQNIVYENNGKTYAIDSKLIESNNTQWAQANNDKLLKQQAIDQTSKDYLTLEKVLFDIHAGITTPSLINDFAAIALIILSLSGIFLFFKKRKTNPSRLKKIQ